jgi:hypothetical protein
MDQPKSSMVKMLIVTNDQFFLLVTLQNFPICIQHNCHNKDSSLVLRPNKQKQHFNMLQNTYLASFPNVTIFTPLILHSSLVSTIPTPLQQ